MVRRVSGIDVLLGWDPGFFQTTRALFCLRLRFAMRVLSHTHAPSLSLQLLYSVKPY